MAKLNVGRRTAAQIAEAKAEIEAEAKSQGAEIVQKDGKTFSQAPSHAGLTVITRID